MATKGAIRKDVPKGTKQRRTRSDPKDTDPSKPLTNFLHERFSIEYIKDFHGAQAYRRAYNVGMGHSAVTNACRLLRTEHIRARVEFLAREALTSEKMNAIAVLRGYARIASLDPRRAFDPSGNMLPIHQLPDDVALAIAGVEITETVIGEGVMTYTKKVKFNDRLGALRDLGKYFKLEGAGDKPASEDQAAVPQKCVVLDFEAVQKKRLELKSVK